MLISVALSQRPYQPMVVEGATWVYVDLGAVSYCSGGPFPMETFIMYQITGDTTIVGITYKKMYQAEADWITERYEQFVEIAGTRKLLTSVREDTLNRKVFWHDSRSMTDKVLYDFSLSKGDTVLDPGGGYPRYAIDTIFYADYIPYKWLYSYNTSRDTLFLPKSIRIATTHQSLNSSRICVDNLLMEGLGLNESYSSGPTNLVRYCRDSTRCVNTIISSREDAIATGLQVYPNPAVGILNIEVPHFSSLQAVSLHTLSGQSFRSKKSVEGSVTQLHIQNIPRGVYVLRIVTRGGHMFYRKVVIR
jgi:hypothetical protein